MARGRTWLDPRRRRAHSRRSPAPPERGGAEAKRGALSRLGRHTGGPRRSAGRRARPTVVAVTRYAGSGRLQRHDVRGQPGLDPCTRLERNGVVIAGLCDLHASRRYGPDARFAQAHGRDGPPGSVREPYLDPRRGMETDRVDGHARGRRCQLYRRWSRPQRYQSQRSGTRGGAGGPATIPENGG